MEEQPEKRKTTGFSGAIDLRRLERQTRRLLYAGFLFSICFHLVVGLLIPYHRPEIPSADDGSERRMKVDIIEIPPPVRNPYLDWKGPQRTLRGRTTFRRGRQVIPGGSPRFKQAPGFSGPAFRLRSDDFGLDAEGLINAIIRGELAKVAREGIRDPEKFRLEPYRLPKLTRRPEGSLSRINLQQEMLRVEDLSTGRYKGLLVLNPSDERDMKGYLYLPSSIYGERLRAPADTRRMVSGLAEVLKQHTGIICRADSQTVLSSPAIAQYPLIVLAADDAFDLSPAERDNVGSYLRGGGFALLEAYGEDSNLPPKGAAPLRQMLRDALGPEGELRPIPRDHPVYQIYFEFSEPPHRARDAVAGAQDVTLLEGAWVGDSLVAVYSEKGYAREWGRPEGSEEFGKFAVNLAVYALTRPDGLALRLVDESGWK